MIGTSHDFYTHQKEDIFKRKEGEGGYFSLNLERLDLITCMSKYFFPFGFTWEEAIAGHVELHSEASW